MRRSALQNIFWIGTVRKCPDRFCPEGENALRNRDEMLHARIVQMENTVAQMEEMARAAGRNRSSRMAELLSRIPRQLFAGKSERQSLLRFVRGGEPDVRFQPLVGLEQKAETIRRELMCFRRYDVPEKSDVTVLFLGTIDFDFLIQRPQHLANGCAANGKAVFYFNAEFGARHPDREEIVRVGSVNVITLQNTYKTPTIYQAAQAQAYPQLVEDVLGTVQKILVWQKNDRLQVIIQHPLWQPVAEMLQQEFGARIIADYLDDFADFDHADKENVRDMAVRMLKNADLTLATSAYLAEKARQSGSRKVELLRNGTDCAHFACAEKQEKGVQKPWIVGYYGVLSTWFDCGKIEALSRSDLDICIRLVGVSDETVRRRLQQLAKVELWDAVPYDKLPEVLRDFDVCLIPFDASTDLIKATNPVKFYEYLSAGKKVVATEIPELMPYDGKYVYCENDDAAFVEKVRACLAQTDGLASKEQCKAFARENDWSARVRQLEELMDIF